MDIRFRSAMAPADVELAAFARRSLLLRLQHRGDRVVRIDAVLAGCTKPLLILRSAKAPQRDSLSVGIAVDGSHYGQAAVRWAIKHRDLFGAEPCFELIHVIDNERTAAPPIEGLVYRKIPVYGVAADDHALASQFAKVMAGALKLFAKADMKVTAAPLLGAHAGDAIAAYAQAPVGRRAHGLPWPGGVQVPRAGVRRHAGGRAQRQAAAAADPRPAACGPELMRMHWPAWCEDDCRFQEPK